MAAWIPFIMLWLLEHLRWKPLVSYQDRIQVWWKIHWTLAKLFPLSLMINPCPGVSVKLSGRKYWGIIQLTWELGSLYWNRKYQKAKIFLTKLTKYFKTKYFEEKKYWGIILPIWELRSVFCKHIFKNTEAWFNRPERKSVLAQAWNELIPAGKKLRTVFFLNTNI